jgi:hypothetical protein
MLTFPIGNGNFTNIAAFCLEPQEKRFTRDENVTIDEVLAYFPRRNKKVDTLLKVRPFLTI